MNTPWPFLLQAPWLIYKQSVRACEGPIIHPSRSILFLHCTEFMVSMRPRALWLWHLVLPSEVIAVETTLCCCRVRSLPPRLQPFRIFSLKRSKRTCRSWLSSTNLRSRSFLSSSKRACSRDILTVEVEAHHCQTQCFVCKPPHHNILHNYPTLPPPQMSITY